MFAITLMLLICLGVFGFGCIVAVQDIMNFNREVDRHDY